MMLVSLLVVSVWRENVKDVVKNIFQGVCAYRHVR